MKKYNLDIDGIKFTIERDKLVWGDGEHHSTRYMIDAVRRYGVKDKIVLDIGTGTGILSVLCGKLGARHILAVDIDKHCLEIAKHNFKENNIEVETKQNNLTNNLNYKADVVLANLHYNVQFENVKTVANVLKEDGLLIMTWNKYQFSFEEHVKGFEVIEHFDGQEYDLYVLRKEK